MKSDLDLRKFLSCNSTDTTGKDEVREILENYIDANPAKSDSAISAKVVIAAVVLCLSLAAESIFFSLRTPREVTWTLATTERGEKKEVILPDSSRIWLNSSSQILYPDKFTGKNRCVYAYGEVYADIAKDRRHPFVMESDGISVRVHGTHFYVKAYRDSKTREVFLEEGSVSLHIDGIAADFDMKPSDMLRYNTTDKTIEKYTLGPSSYPSWRISSNQSFVNMTFSDIVDHLRRTFGVDIIVSGKINTSNRYYGSFINGEDAFQILSALNTDNSLDLRQKDNCIIISSNK